MNLEQIFPQLFGTKHGFVSRIDIDDFEARLKDLGVLDKYFRVEFEGLENVPYDGGALVVGNHGPFGIDAPFIMKYFYEERGRIVRPLGDRLLFKIPFFRIFLNSFGVLEGESQQAIRVLQAGEICSVYPGGYAETIKSPEEKYQIRPFWRNHYGFIKVALRARVPIIPVSCVGVDDIVFQLRTAEQTSVFPPARAIQKFMDHPKYKVPLWMGLGPLPVPAKFTYKVGKPIDLAYGPEAAEDYEILEELHEKIVSQIEEQLEQGLKERQDQRGLSIEAVESAPKMVKSLYHQAFGSKE